MWAGAQACWVTGRVPACEAAPYPEPAAAILREPGPLAPAAEPAQLPGFAPITNPNLAFGLAGVNEWSVQQPFLDVMKTARAWVGHMPGLWGGWDHEDLAAMGVLDDNGRTQSLASELSAGAVPSRNHFPLRSCGVDVGQCERLGG